MPKPVKVLAVQADQSGCGRFRISRPAAAVNEQGLAEVTVIGSLTADIRTNEDGSQEVVNARLPGLPDVAVIQRPLRMLTVSFIRFLQAQGVKVIVEIDDDIVHLPPKHPLGRVLVQGSHPTDECRDALLDACKIADMVTTTTPALASLYAPHGRYSIIPNAIPRQFIDQAGHFREKNPVPVVGYAGAGGFHYMDLEQVGNGLRQAQATTGFKFLGLGGTDFPKRLHVEGRTEFWREMDDYSREGYVAYLSQFDIGLAPLRACLFAEGKSDLKLLEYAGLGIPMVASPTADYRRTAHGLPLGSCTIARTPREWREAVQYLVENPKVRAAMYQPLKDYARTRTFDARAKDWAEAWRSVL